MSAHDIDVLLDAARDGDTVEIPSGWGQGRATFGGVVGGALVARGLGALDVPEVTLRAATVNFLAPVTPGPARLTTEVLRRGSSATQAEIRLMQVDPRDGEETARAVALLTVGAERGSDVEVRGSGPEDGIDPTDVEPLPYIPGVTPDFIGKVELLQTRGQWAFTGSTTADVAGHMRFREPTEHFGLAHLVTLIDAWPPAAAQMLSGPAALSSMTWNLDFVAPFAVEPNHRWWYEVTTEAAHHGYAHASARIYTADGELVALSHQTIAIFG